MREGRVLSLAHVSQNEILTFADSKVNLHRDDVKGYREQVWRLRDKLETYLSDHPDFSLKKMMLSGSLAKGTALCTWIFAARANQNRRSIFLKTFA